MTPSMTRATAKDNVNTGIYTRWACIATSGICLWRLAGLAISSYHTFVQIGMMIVFLPVFIGVCYLLLPICISAIWKESSNYHQRTERKYLISYAYGDNDGYDRQLIEEAKKWMYKFWVNVDDTLPIIAALALLIFFIGGGLAIFSIGAGWGTTFSAAFFSGQWGAALCIVGPIALFCVYCSIAFPINSGHMEDDANQYEKHREICDKFYQIEEIKKIAAGPKGLGTTVPAGSLEDGEEIPQIGGKKNYDITAQFKTVGDPVNIAIPMDGLPPRRNE